MVLIQPDIPSPVLERIEYGILGCSDIDGLDIIDPLNAPSEILSSESIKIFQPGEHADAQCYSNFSKNSLVANDYKQNTPFVQLDNNGNNDSSKDDDEEEEISFIEVVAGAKASNGYMVRELAGRGCGLVATKRFYPGDLIIREKPIIVMPDKIFRFVSI